MTGYQNEYRTRGVSLAVFLRFVLGDAAHLETVKEERGCSFTFADRKRCLELADAFFSEVGAAVDNAKALLDCERDLRQTMRAAQSDSEGIWLSDFGAYQSAPMQGHSSQLASGPLGD